MHLTALNEWTIFRKYTGIECIVEAQGTADSWIWLFWVLKCTQSVVQFQNFLGVTPPNPFAEGATPPERTPTDDYGASRLRRPAAAARRLLDPHLGLDWTPVTKKLATAQQVSQTIPKIGTAFSSSGRKVDSSLCRLLANLALNFCVERKGCQIHVHWTMHWAMGKT